MAKTIPIHAKTLGHSVLGAPIEGYFLNCRDDGHTVDTLFLGVFHGDEGISGALTMCFMEYITRQPDWSLFGFHADTPLILIPVVNPDGMAKIQRTNANGVDLNRNFPTRDWARQNEETPYYSGSSPASEPETRIILDLLEKYPPLKIITIHSPYQVINYDGPALALAEAMGQKNGYPVTEDIGYATPGSFGTYTGKERNIPVVTLELPEEVPLDTVWRDNRDALLEAVRFRVETL